MRVADCDSTPSRAFSRTPRSRTSRRRAGAFPITSGSSAASASTSSFRFVEDREVELLTWSQRACLRSPPGDVGRSRGTGAGTIEVDSVWIHLGPDERPSAHRRLRSVRRVRGRPPRLAPGSRSPIHPPMRSATAVARASDGHRPPRPSQQRRLLAGSRGHASFVADLIRTAAPRVPRLPTASIDVDDVVHVVEWSRGRRVCVAFVADDSVKAVARVDRFASPRST